MHYLMRRIVVSLLLVITTVSVLIPFATQVATIHADSPAPVGACATTGIDGALSGDCLAEIQGHPMPDLVHPAAPEDKKYGYSHPRGVLFPDATMPYEFGWVLKDWFYSDTPGTTPKIIGKDRSLKKASMHYVYATVKIKAMEWHLIGPNQWIAGENFAVLHVPKRPDGVSGRWITLDLARQTLIAMQDDKPVFGTLISAGYDGYGFTHEGLYHIYARTRFTTFRGPPWKAVPDYVLNHVPDVMFFDHHVALHGAYWHDWFGFPRSHGCVNIPVGDEAWLWDWVSEALNHPDESKFFLDDPNTAPYVYVYKSGTAYNQG
jgi:hypothetical protein